MARNLTEGSMAKNMIRMAIPLILSGLCTQAFNAIDMAVAGQILGDDALAAIGGTSSLIQFLSSLFWGACTGISLYTGKVFGSGKMGDAYTSARLSFFFALFGGTLIGGLAVILKAPVFTLLHIQSEVYGLTYSYFAVFFLGLGVIVASASLSYSFHAVGDTVAPLLISIGVSLLNIAGNFFFLLCTPLSVAGVALSSVLSAGCGVLVKAVLLRRTFRRLGGLGPFRPTKEMVRSSLRFGLPCMCQQSALYFSSVAVSPIVNSLGTDATAGYAVGMKVYGLISGVFQNHTKSVSVYVSQSLGAKKYGKILSVMPMGWLQSTLFTLPVMLFAFLFPEQIVVLFFKDGNGAAFSYAADFCRICVPFIFFAIFANLFHAYYRGTGAMGPLLGCTCTYTAARILLSLLLVGYGIGGIYFALGGSWIVESVCAVTVFFLGIWKPKEMREWERENRRTRAPAPKN